MPFKKKFTVMPVDGGFAIAIYEKPTGQVYATEKAANNELTKLSPEKAAKVKQSKSVNP